ncbi:ATP-dependent DNA helicase [Cohnella herbarum]|uniref:ATP-dependent DNA helicase n=1 Tax=Cohnella herbarum TaxID=2728023 RepID=A0A7Z2VLP9_9BACL|nr:ATP-dependent DNA helicase [Cohnella herbarum]QJD85377.1 ATP-dependent DNA helicase [Cohnella herbarum]
MPDLIALSVRGLVEYVFRGGSLDSGFRTWSTLAEGTKAHQKIQKQYGESDRKEVYVSAEIPYEELLFVVDGRCDGLLVGEDGGITIDEIKSTARDVGAMTAEDSYPVHWAQAKFYAYMFAKDKGLDRIRVRLTYVQVDTEEQRRFEQEVGMEELERYVTDIVQSYAPYARLLERNRESRDISIAGLPFPFPQYREGQRKLVGSVYKSIDEGRKLFAKAPTGIGKTISTLYPTIKAIGLGKVQHLFYLTARTITRLAAEDALSLMKAQGLHLRSVTITAKDKICFQDEVDCRPDKCPYADGYYDRINGAILDLLGNETLMNREVIEKYARKHSVCPFEMSLDAAYGADAVICDYNYVFDPRVSLKRMTGEHKHQTVLLVDEAHNLIDRAREMYSAALDKRNFMELEREFKGVRKEIHAAAKAINKWFIACKKQGNGQVIVTKEKPDELLELVEEFTVQAERELAGSGSDMGNATLLETYFDAMSFIRIGKLYDDSYITYTEMTRNDVRLKMFCLNPAYLLRQMGKGFRSHVFFSATLSPLNYFMDMLGAEEEDYSVTLGSPFAKEQWEVSIVPLSTRYADRERTKARLVNELRRLTMERRGNYLIFFPSYEYMNGVYGEFVAANEETLPTLLQTPDMSEEERERFLAAFSPDNDRTLIGFAVMGGIFSEGIDLVGDRLSGVAVVGVGMPQIGLERNLIKGYFDEEGRNGFDYAYVYPGINKVLQAGGRLIRSDKDRGVLALIDDRYTQPQYSRLLPEEWRG